MKESEIGIDSIRFVFYSRYYFHHDKWLAKDKEDSKICREIYFRENKQMDLPIISRATSQSSSNYDEESKSKLFLSIFFLCYLIDMVFSFLHFLEI